ncbi:hypothetical protein BAE44_0011649 [Dichanthelium oligosanthes]|uniref:Uncharacterized protein n=1 Tax=Dichanthelium oligosanthes TaxID=888268 RepID=A0A1E5VQH3_9POAL|nr:hypothetical protein BAE44_0011649 [Dichanthelium oligosanthes]
MSRFEALGECHTEAQREYSYDKYIDDEVGVEVEDDCISFEQFKRMNTPSVNPPAASSNYDLNYPIIGAVGTIDYKCPVTPDPTKKFILSIILGAQRVMDDDKCYEPLTSNNIVVTSEGQPLFKHLRMVRLSAAAKLAVYKSIATVITELFEGFPVPGDMQHLIDLLNSGRKEALYKIHSALVPHSDRGWLFLKAYEYVMHRADPVSQSLILLALPYLQTWRTKVDLNHVLIEAYDYVEGAYNEAPPVDESGNPIAWSETDKKLQSAKKFMDYLRNGTSHRLQRSHILTADQYETLLLVLFHMLLPKLLEAMFDHLNVGGLRKAGLLRYASPGPCLCALCFQYVDLVILFFF